jgi:hypothetical protein
MTAHKHAAAMLQYAQDAAETDKPWERWEGALGDVYSTLDNNPNWSIALKYRRKQPATVTVTFECSNKGRSTMTANKHANIFRALADGDDISKWECKKDKWLSTDWQPVNAWFSSITTDPENWTVRRKEPAMRIVTFECWNADGILTWGIPEAIVPSYRWTRVPEHDKTAEVPAP